ncbi:hypothetical protein BV25DRAFT_1913050 [Artomyces pyxidatus]|uniref:Uncharacterized protein n=1 Tax=Artomyces pyxidatus TaxID=48021 RepID=A0ACB8TDE6_9AGAM|nr:hypothetical protein BV25DRAFT_1913050 [Artomyces pyxidatus]
MAPSVSGSVSEIVALCVESVLYGIYLVLFIGCAKVLVNKRTDQSRRLRLIIVSGSLFVLITWHEVIDAVRLVFSVRNGQTMESIYMYYADATSTLSVLKTAIYLVETVLYRCYIVWDAKWPVVLLPILLYIADCGTGIAAVYTLTLTGTNVWFNEKQERITNSFFSCTLALNTVCTALIAFRIWWWQPRTRPSSTLKHVTITLIESGAIYLVTLALLVATYSAKVDAFKVFLDVTSPVIGIVFSLIIVRVGRGVSSETTHHGTISGISFNVSSKRANMTTSTGISGGTTDEFSRHISPQGLYRINEIKVDVDVEQSSL